MFKNYLSYSLAENFHRSCLSLNIEPAPLKNSLMSSSEMMLNHFAKAIQSRDSKEVSKNLFVALFCLRDCWELLDEAHLRFSPEMKAQYSIVQARLEQLCLDASSAEEGQLRMIA